MMPTRPFHILCVIRRFLVFAAISFWLGGFTFYASVAVPVGMQVLGSHLRQGFITQQVTGWLNLSGLVALAILTWNMLAEWDRSSRLIRIGLSVSMMAMIAIQAELFILHPFLDRLLDARARQIIDDERFDFLHRVYLVSSTIQWFFGLLHVLCIAALQCGPHGSSGSLQPDHAKMPGTTFPATSVRRNWRPW